MRPYEDRAVAVRNRDGGGDDRRRESFHGDETDVSDRIFVFLSYQSKEWREFLTKTL